MAKMVFFKEVFTFIGDKVVLGLLYYLDKKEGGDETGTGRW